MRLENGLELIQVTRRFSAVLSQQSTRMEVFLPLRKGSNDSTIDTVLAILRGSSRRMV